MNSSRVLSVARIQFRRVLGTLYVEDASAVHQWRNLPSGRKTHILGYFQDWSLVDEIWTKFSENLAQSEAWRSIFEAPPIPRVAIHYRLGDYVTNPTARRHHGVTHPTFFASVVAEVRSSYPLHKVVLVSDDPELATSLFSTHCDAFEVDQMASPNAEPLEHLALLADSTHVVTSNSSFSWWGGWLGWKKGAEVFLPEPWFVAEAEHHALIPPQWSRRNRTLLSDQDLEQELARLGRPGLGNS